MASIATVHRDDLTFEVSLARRLFDAVGFLPYKALEFYAAQRGIFRCHENDEPAGFLVMTRSLKEAPRIAQIFQTAIHWDLQRRHHGLAIVNHAVAQAGLSGAEIIRCWCAADLTANEFWAAAGFQNCGERQGGKRRQRKHILWQKPLRNPISAATLRIDQQEARQGQQMSLFDHRPIFR